MRYWGEITIGCFFIEVFLKLHIISRNDGNNNIALRPSVAAVG
jgi:hypothetical protein